MKRRVGALIFQDKQLLLVTGYDETLYWTPGGKREGIQTDYECLKEELLQELGVQFLSGKEYFSTLYTNERTGEQQELIYYIVQVKGDIVCGNEITQYKWFSKEEIEKESSLFPDSLLDFIFPKLLKDSLL